MRFETRWEVTSRHASVQVATFQLYPFQRALHLIGYDGHVFSILMLVVPFNGSGNGEKCEDLLLWMVLQNGSHGSYFVWMSQKEMAVR
jgi:hypothetical protein